MTKDVFKSVDFWKSAVMKMQDNSFFELLRSVFGKIKTPFNKQQLLNDLEKFLLRDDIQKTIAAYIDDTEAKIITAVSLFGEPFFRQLENFFSGEYGSAQLQDIIVNMEERFILYRFTDEKNNSHAGKLYSDNAQQIPREPHKNAHESRLALNPVLKTVLLPYMTYISALFPQADSPAAAQSAGLNDSAQSNQCAQINQQQKEAVKTAFFNDLILVALYSFIAQWDAFFKSEDVIRKRVIDEAKIIFPGIDFENVIGALQILGLFYADGQKLTPDKKLFGDFSMLSARERTEYFAAALLIYSGLSPSPEILPPLYKNKIREIAGLINSFSNLLDENIFYPEKTFKRVMEILNSQTETGFSGSALFDVLEKTGLVIKSKENMFKIDSSCCSKNTRNAINDVSHTITIDSGFSILAHPEIEFSDAVKLASVLNIRDAGSVPGSTIVRFELNKDSAVRAFNNDIDAQEIVDLLNRLSGGKVNDNLVWNLNDWEKRYKDVSLTKGVILKLSPDHRYLTETYPLVEMITETLAPGIYLLNEDSMEESISALHNAGIDIIASLKKHDEKNAARFFNCGERKEFIFSPASQFPSVDLPQNNALLSLENFTTDIKDQKIKRGKVRRSDLQNSVSQEKIKNSFHAVLEKMRLGDAEKNELSARIDRRLILCEAQLKDADIRYEKLEARHMDYTGKQNVAKQAISQKSPVEIVLPVKGKEKRIFGIPQSLEKEENEIILVINTMHTALAVPSPEKKDDSDEIKRIPLAKISLLRRIKKSIFEN